MEGITNAEGRVILVNTPHLDWVTITSFDRALAEWGAEFGQADGQYSATPAKPRGGYFGVHYDGVDILEGRQKGHPHTLVNVTGARAWQLDHITSPPADMVNCTRLDAALTIEEPAGYDAVRLYEVLAHPIWYPWKGAGGQPIVTLYRSPTGATVYVGSPRSQKRVRVYQKDVAGQALLRYEVQLRGYAASRAYQEWQKYGNGLAGDVIASSLSRWPDICEDIRGAFLAQLDGTGEFEVGPHTSTERTRAEWIETVVVPAVRTALKGRYRKDVLGFVAEMLHADTEDYGTGQGGAMDEEQWAKWVGDMVNGMVDLKASEIFLPVPDVATVAERWHWQQQAARREIKRALADAMGE